MRNSHLGMYRFDGGYVSFSNDTINGWHFYISDYMGNNRMVVRDSIIEQITHYYPYGGVIGDISTLLSDVTKGNNENMQKYKFEDKELDRTFGLDNYDIHARQYFAMAPMWDMIDPLAEKYYGISPYAYCGGDPINNVDLKGDSICVLLARNGAKKFGHMALLIQDKETHKWHYYSKEGHDRVSVIGEKPYDTVKDFLDSTDEEKYGKDRYTDSYIIPTDENDTDSEGKTPDERAKEAAILEINTDYDVVTANCSHVVTRALSAAGKPNGYVADDTGENSIPKYLFVNIVIQNERLNTLIDLWERIKRSLSN